MKALIVFLLLVSSSAFAGDLYLLCMDADGTISEDATLTNGKGSLTITFMDGGERVSAKVSAKPAGDSLYQLSAVVKRGGRSQTVSAKLPVLEYGLMLSEEVGCGIAD
jgi:hypothetical protein